MEACRAQVIRAEAEWRLRAEEDVSRERTELGLIKSSFETERAEFLQRIATAEALGQACEARVCLISQASIGLLSSLS